MTREQMEMLRKNINTYMMMAQVMKEHGNIDSMKAYAKEGKKSCLMLIEANKAWEEDATEIFQMVA